MKNYVSLPKEQRGISFDRFIHIVTDISSCASKNYEDADVWSDKSKRALRSIYDTIYKKYGFVEVRDASIIGQTMLAQNVGYE